MLEYLPHVLNPHVVSVLNHALADVRRRIASACQRSGRDPASVRLVCVTKGVAPELIREAVASGVTDIGENRVQEAQQKFRELYEMGEGSRVKGEGVGFHPPPSTLHRSVKWHLIGHLQRNKAKDAVQLFDMIHSVDSVVLAQELEKHAVTAGRGAGGEGRGKIIDIFVQVNISGEATKFGCTAEETPQVAHAITQLPHLRLCGLMTIPPLADEPEAARPHFRRLRELRDHLASTLHPSPRTTGSPACEGGEERAWNTKRISGSHGCKAVVRGSPFTLHLSMGMSHDFEVAIEEGADFVRIGSAIFQGETG